MIFTDEIDPKHYHFFMAFENADLKPGEKVDGMLIWDRKMWPTKGYYASDYTRLNVLRYKLFRLGAWLAWRECDLMDEIITRLRIHGFEGIEAGWKSIWSQLRRAKN